MPTYDLAVLGAGLGGLAVAARAVRAGKRVILFDPAGQPGGTAADRSAGGQRFTAGPALIYGFEPGGPLRAFWSELGIPMEGSTASPAYQVALPDRRITVSPDAGATLEELRREFPREIDRISRLYREAAALAARAARSRASAYLIRRRPAGALLSGCRPSMELQAFFDVMADHFFGETTTALPLDLFALLLSRPPHALERGFGGIAQVLCDLVVREGGRCILDSSWPEVQAHSGRITALRTDEGVLDVGAVIVCEGGWIPDRKVLVGLAPEGAPVNMLMTVLCLPGYGQRRDVFTLASSPPGAGPGGVLPLTATFFGGLASRPFEDLTGLIGGIIPFFPEVALFTADDDGGNRTLPASLSGYERGTPLPRRSARLRRSKLKNLYGIPDSYPETLRAFQIARSAPLKLA